MVSNHGVDVVVINAAALLFAGIERDVVSVEVGVNASRYRARWYELSIRF